MDEFTDEQIEAAFDEVNTVNIEKADCEASIVLLESILSEIILLTDGV